MHTIFLVLSIVLVLAAMPPYIIDILKGKTKPERMTWLIWSGLGITAFVSQAALGATWSLFFSGLDLLGSVIILGLSIKYGVGGLSFNDKLAFVLAVIGILASLIAKQPVIAILGVVLADVSAAVLTWIKVWRDPGSETTISWLLFATGGVCSLFLIRPWSWALAVYPLYLAVANYIVPMLQLLRKRS